MKNVLGMRIHVRNVLGMHSNVLGMHSNVQGMLEECPRNVLGMSYTVGMFGGGGGGCLSCWGMAPAGEWNHSTWNWNLFIFRRVKEHSRKPMGTRSSPSRNAAAKELFLGTSVPNSAC